MIVTVQGANLFFDIIFAKNRMKIKIWTGILPLYPAKFKVLQEPTYLSYLSAKANVFCSRTEKQKGKPNVFLQQN